ncbi:hypothetical protein MTP99_008396 [Tenebrio molitor]|nr:hypothetical protein MTP99_008396 [Tenebrio molitor]
MKRQLQISLKSVEPEASRASFPHPTPPPTYMQISPSKNTRRTSAAQVQPITAVVKPAIGYQCRLIRQSRHQIDHFPTSRANISAAIFRLARKYWYRVVEMNGFGPANSTH